jgi:hypothetical protein
MPNVRSETKNGTAAVNVVVPSLSAARSGVMAA